MSERSKREESRAPTPREGETAVRTTKDPTPPATLAGGSGTVAAASATSKRQRQRQGAASGERLLAAVLEKVHDAVILADDEGRFIDANPAACGLFGLARERLVGQQLATFMPAGFDVETCWQSFLRGDRLPAELPLVRGSAEPELVATQATAEVLPGLHLLVLRDAGRHTRTQESLRLSEERLRTVAANAPIVLFVLDGEARYAWVGGGGLAPLGLRADDLIGKSAFDPGGILAGAEDAIRRALAGETVTWSGAIGSGHYDAVLSPLLGPHGELAGVTGASINVTRRTLAEETLRQTSEQLRQAQKMEALGSLAGGVAHDFNNLLTVILSYSNLLLDEVGAGSPHHADLAEIKKAGERAQGLTRQLLAFGRRQMLHPSVLDLNQVVGGMENLLHRLLGETVELTLLAAGRLGAVRADPSQVELAIMNLVVNAKDAMPHGGRLTIETTNVELDDDYAGRHVGVAPGSYVALSIVDTGAGMDRATQARIFEPFFTTKGVGKGTGLGLSTVFGIVQQSGGHIAVESEPGRGSTFRVYFPRTDGTVESRTTQTQIAIDLRGTETVLLVEDEEQVRNLARTLLRRCGYNVLEASNAGDALLVCEQYEQPIDLLLTDLVMPRLNGRQLAARLTKLRPEMKVLYMSGYTDDAAIRANLIDDQIAFLEKPFTPAGLARKVREVIGAPRVDP